MIDYPYEVELKLTCEACPEQYDAFYLGKKIGYLRLRHGIFTVDYPFCGEKIIFTAYPEGDGMFFDEEERSYYLGKAKIALMNEYNRYI
jgi:hypothetical protein